MLPDVSTELSAEKLEFIEILNQFDPMYRMSDDMSVYKRHDRLRARLADFEGKLSNAFVTYHWNKMVERNVAEPFRDQYYWRMK